MESEDYKERVSKWSRNVKDPEDRISYRSKISKSYEDPMPEYISPELVMLIAQNAPSELDVFKKSLKHWGKLPARTRSLDWQEQRRGIKIAREVECQKEYEVQVISSSENEEKHNPKQFAMNTQRSCPEMVTWSDYDTKDSRAPMVKNVKRKRPKSLDICKSVSRDTRSSISVNSLGDKQEDDPTRTVADDVVSFLKSVDCTPSDIEQKLERPSSAPVVSALRYESAALNEKPWRHGMKKHTSTRLKQTESISCKRKAEVDPKKLAEVKKYMETKFAQLRNERQLQKARAEAALAARKEKQRKLDVECQALLKSQATDVKIKQKPFSRPPWTSDYVTLAEVFRPWSRASTGNLPPPKVPRNQEPVPLDLYTTIATYEAAQKSLFGEACNRSSFSKLKAKKWSNKMKVRNGEKQLPKGKTKSDMYEMAFPPTHPYHVLRPYPKVGSQKKTSSATKARWKSKRKSLKRFNLEKIYQPKCHDLLGNRKMEKTSCAPHNEHLRRETSARRMQKRCKNSSQIDITNVLRQDDCYAISALKHERDVCARSRVKRLRPTSPPTTEHISLARNDSKPKYSRVRPAKRGHVAVHSKERSLQGIIAEVMNSRLPPDPNRETVCKTRDSISPGTLDSRLCRQASVSPHKHLRLSQVLKPTTIELLSPCSSRNDNKPQVFDSTRAALFSPDEHFKVGGTMQVIRPQRNDMTNVDIESNKDVTRDLRRQRMRMLRSLADQLVKRMEAACAEQQVQNTPKTTSEPTSEPHVHNVPFNQSVGLYCSDEPLLVEPNFVNHSPRLDILCHAHLSELEQAGCQTVELPEGGGSEVISNVNHLSKDPFETDNRELNVFSRSEITSHACNVIDNSDPQAWQTEVCNVIDKDISMSDNIPSGCSSYGRSSPSTDSSSPVILPTGAKYNIRRTKCNKNIEEQARKRQKEAWRLPAEEDIHSVINLYTQHWLSREMKKNQARCELTQTGGVESEENTCPRSRSCTSLHDHAPEKHKFKFGVAPNTSELEVSEPCTRSLEPNGFSSTKCAETSGVYTEQLESDHRKPLAYQESTIHHIDMADTPASVENSMAPIIVEPMQEDNEKTKKLAGDPCQRKPEGMLVQIGDMRLCQSPTSFHLRVDTHKDDRQLKKPLRDLGTSERPSKMESTGGDAYTHVVSSEDSQTHQSPIVPMKITYARRVRRRTTPDGTSTDDERIIVEFHRINKEGDELARQNYNTELEPSRSSTSKTSLETLSVSMVEVQNLDDPSCNPKVQNDIHPTDESRTLDKSNVLQPETLGSCTNTEADSFPSLNYPTERFEEKLDRLSTKTSHSVGGSGCPQLLNTTDQREGCLDGLPTKSSSDFAGESICSKVNPELASIEAENWWNRGEDQKSKHNTSENSTTPSTYDRLYTFGSKNKSQCADNESIVQDTAERQLELLSESKLEVQSDLLQSTDNTLEVQLKSRRHQLEVELQKLDAEIRRTRAKLQANQNGSDTKTRNCKQSATSVIAKDKSSTASSEKTDCSKTSEVLSGDLISGRLSHPLPSNRTLLDPPRQKATSCLPEEATSAPNRTFDRIMGSPIHSTSFVSEDIQMEEGTFSTRIEETIPDTGGERYGSQYELPCRERRFINEISRDCGEKASPICQHYESVKEVSEEELLSCRTASTQDDEGSENSTGRVPYRRFERPSLCKRQEATIPSASSELQGSPSRHSEDHIVTLAYQEVQPVAMEERNDSFLSRISVENHTLDADKEFIHNAKATKDETSTPFGKTLPKGEVTASTDTDLREERHNGCSYIPSTHNGRVLNHIASDGRESGSRSPIHLQQAKRVADKVHAVVDENSTMDTRQDGTPYGAGIYSSLELGNSSTPRRTMMTTVTTVTKVPPRKTSRSSPVRKQWQVDVTKDLSSSSEDGAESSFLAPKAPEVVDVVEGSPSSSRNGTEGKSKTSEIAINTTCNLKGETAEISEVVKVFPLNPSDGTLQKSDPSACVCEPLLSRTSKQASEGAQEGEGSCNSEKRGNITTVFSAVETSTNFHHPLTPHEILDGTPSELKEPLDLRENFEILTTRDRKNDPVKETSSPNWDEENPTQVGLQDEDFSTPESSRMRRLWRLDSEVPQNLTEDSKAESTKQLLQIKKKSLTKSTGDKAKLVTNLPNPNVETSIAAVPRVRSKRLRQSHEYEITSEVRGSECFRQAPRSSVSVAKGTITNGAVEVISGSSNSRIESSRSPSDLPHSGDPLSQSYFSNSAKAPVRSQWGLYDFGHNGKTDQINASRDSDQSTETLTDVANQVVPSFCKQKVPIFFPDKTLAPAACEKSSEVEEFQKILLESSRTGENPSTTVLEVNDDFIAAREDAHRDCPEVKQDCEGFRPVQPSPLMSKNKVGYQELANVKDDMTKVQQKLLPPVLLSETSKPLEISPTRFRDKRGEEHLKAKDSTSKDHQAHIPDIKCDFGTDVVSVEHPEKDASAMLIALSRTLMRSIDTTEITFGSSIKDDFKETASSSSCGQSGDIAGTSPNRMDLGLHKETTGDLDDLDGECSNQYSTWEPSGALIHTVTSSSSGRSSLTTVLEKNENQEMATNAVQEEVGLVSNSHMEDMDPEGGTTADILVSRSYFCARGEVQTPFQAELNIPKSISSLPIKISEDNESLTKDISSSKSTSSCPSLGEEDCLDVSQNQGQNLNLERESSWSEDEGKSDEPHTISPQRADDKLDRKDASKGTLERLEALEETHVSIPQTTHAEFTSHMSAPPTSYVSEEAHRLVECFLSSGSQLLDRATQVSNAFASCSRANNSPGNLPSPENCEQRIDPTPDDSSLFRGLPSKVSSISSATEKAEDGQRNDVFTCEPDGAKAPEFLHPSRPDQIIALRSSNPTQRQNGNSTLYSKPAVVDGGINENDCKQDLNSVFTTPSGHDKITAQQSSTSRLDPSTGLFTGSKHFTAPRECTTKEDMQHELETKRSSCVKDKTSTGPELSELTELTSSIPQLASAVAISLQIPDTRESSSNCYGDKLCLEKENSNVETAFEARENREGHLCKLSTEDTSAGTGYDKHQLCNSNCSLDESGQSHDLARTLGDIKVQTAASRTRKHNMMADTLTDMLFEALLADGLSDLASPSRSTSPASSTEDTRTKSVSRTSRPKIKGKSNKGFIAVLKHFLPVGWRAVSPKHKTGLFLQVKGLKQHPLTSAPRKALSISGIEGLTETLQNKYPSWDDFEQSSLVNRAATETAVPQFTDKDYIQCYVEKTLRLANLNTDPSPSNWYDSTVPIAQDIYGEVMEKEQGDWQIRNKLLFDLINESLIKYSATLHQLPSTLPFQNDGGNVVQLVTSRIVEQVTSQSTHGSDVDKVVRSLFEAEQWEKCYEEARDLISELAQGILSDLIERFVQEMIQGRNITSSRFRVIDYKNSRSC